jgi:hypothetical protein
MKKRARTEGYEPARGFPEPGDVRDDGRNTHSPHANGTVCGLKLTDASAYTVEAPTCETCRRHYDAVQRSAQRIARQAQESQARFDAAQAASTSPESK